MARKYGYINQLLSNLAVDHSRAVRTGLVGPILLPRIPVPRPSGQYAIYDKETAFIVPDVTMAGERSQANEFSASAKKEKYATVPHGLKAFIDAAELEFMEGPFRVWELRKTELLVSKLELAQEKRIADKLLYLDGRSTTLSGSGDGAGNKWANGGGDPFKAINAAIAQFFYRPNVMVFNEVIYAALEYHPKLIAKLGEANLIKKVDEANLAKLFRIDRVIISKGRADFGKRNNAASVTPTDIWGDALILAHTSDEWDAPCAGKTLCLQYQEADSDGYVVRTWDEEDGGVLGGEYVQVAHETDELIVCPELVYTIKGAL
jgi:hypothetical protein